MGRQAVFAATRVLARELAGARLLVVGTYRDVELSRQHPLAETLGGLNRERLFQRVLLRGLTQEDVARFIETAAGIEPPTGLAAAVHTQTEGNPLFVTEVVHLLVQEGALAAEQASTRESWTVRIPEGVREVIGRRLNRMSQRCNETLTIASVIGREFEMRQLAPLIEDTSEDRLLGVLEEALAARIIEELPQFVGRYQFTHALIQETLAEELYTTRRVRLHARIGETLEAQYGDHAEDHAAELAHHFAEAEAVLGSGKLVRYALLAGEQALSRYAWEESLTHFQRALLAKGVPATGQEPAQDAETAALLSGLGRAQLATQPPWTRDSETTDIFSRAFAYYADVGDLERAVPIAEYPYYPSAGQSGWQTEIIRRALGLVPPDSYYAGRLLSQNGRIIGMEEGDYDRARDAFEQGLEIAQREGDVSLQMRILADAGNVDYYHAHRREGLDKSLRVIQLSVQTEEPQAQLLAHFDAVFGAIWLGDLALASEHAADVMTLAEQVRDRSWINRACRVNEIVCRVRGDWPATREFSNRGLAISPTTPPQLYTRVLMEYQVGEIDQGDVYLQRLIDRLPLKPPGPILAWSWLSATIAVAAYMNGYNEHLDVSAAAAEAVISSPFVSPMPIQCARVGLALIAVVQKDEDLARQQYSPLLSYQGTMMLMGDIAGDRVLGLLACAMGEIDQASAHFDDALSFCRKAGYRPELAWTCCDYADTLKERDATGDRSRAITLLDESLAISSELGMRPLMERVLARKLELQGVASADIRTSIDAVASAVTIERPDLRPHTAPDGTVTILFSDIEGFTQMTERLGDQRMQQVLRGHNDIVRHQVAAYGGFEVKSLGDGFMLAFSSARRALQCSISIQRAFAAHNQEHPEEPVRVRIGLHTGEFVQEMEDFFGKNVILASRIADQAQGGEILVSSLLKELTESGGDIRFGDVQEVELKGLAGLNRVYPVVWE